jgi:hypothetical protein
LYPTLEAENLSALQCVIAFLFKTMLQEVTPLKLSWPLMLVSHKEKNGFA